MSGAYAKEYERWLERTRSEMSKTSSNDLDLCQIGDSEDEVDNSYEIQAAVFGGSQEITGDAAPILSDDDDNDGDYDDGIRSEVEEEEPPILEPVPSMPNQKQSNKPSASDESPVKCVKSVTKGKTRRMSLPGVDPSLQKNSSGNEKGNVEIGKKVFNCEDGQKLDDELLKQSGNIFDKFSAISEQSDDIPPPLIPSPEALFTDASSNCSDEKFNIKQDNSPPDFCAMEADSTSEILNANVDDGRFSKKVRNALKNSHGDASIECDSTCMLGASPSVVSSGFASTLDVDDVGNQQDCQGACRESMDMSNEESYTETRLNESRLDQCSSIQAKEEDKKACSWNQECPTLEVASHGEERKIRENALAEGPPVLSVIVEESPFQSLRRKRHTIDTVENISSSSKRKHDISFLPLKSDRQVDVDLLEPPHLPRQDDIKDFSPSQLDSKKSSKKKQTDSSKKNYHMKGKRRCRSYSLIDLNKFVKRTSRLSQLQTKMHRLVSLLFPQIKHELKNMSPESIHFENILVDLTSSLYESTDTNEDSGFCCQVNVDEDQGSVVPSKNSSACAQNSKSVFVQSDISQSMCFSSCTSSCHHKETSFVPSKHSTVSNLTPSPGNGEWISNEPSVNESMIPQLSQLSLISVKDKILKRQPSVVIRADVSEALRSFSKLACNVLQVLLPDLTVSLFEAFGDSYQDLVTLIDSVILSNSS